MNDNDVEIVVQKPVQNEAEVALAPFDKEHNEANAEFWDEMRIAQANLTLAYGRVQDIIRKTKPVRNIKRGY